MEKEEGAAAATVAQNGIFRASNVRIFSVVSVQTKDPHRVDFNVRNVRFVLCLVMKEETEKITKLKRINEIKLRQRITPRIRERMEKFKSR